MPKTNTKTKPANSAFMAPVKPDDKLAAIVGASPLPRTAIVSKLWVYIKKNGLQDPKNKRQINADEALKGLFNGKKSATMFELSKYISLHISKA